MQVILFVFAFLLSLSQGAKIAWTKVDFSVKRGFFTAPFDLKFDPPFVGASIRYTLSTSWDDRVEPSTTNGILYVPGTAIRITRTSVVKAFGWTNSQRTNITTHTYIFPADVAKQSTMGTPDPKYAPSLIPGLLTMPSVSVTSLTPYPTYQDKGRPLFKVMVEWIDPANSDNDWSESAGCEIYGGYSVTYPKKSLRFHFREDFGSDDLSEPVFKGFDWGVGAIRSYTILNMRGHSQDGMDGYQHGWRPLTWMKNIWHDWAVQDIGSVAPHARYAHMYFNGQYQGIYHVRERFGTHMLKEYFGGVGDEYCAVSKGVVYSGPAALCPWNQMKANPNWNYMKSRIDINSYLDYCILTHYGGNLDLAYEHNWQAGGPIKPAPFLGKDAGFKFFLSDQDATFFGSNYNHDVTGGGYLGNTFQGLVAEKHPEFMVKFQDRIFRHLFSPRGLLLPAAVRARFDRIQNIFTMNNSIIPEFARWGFRSNNQFTVDDWKAGINDLYSFYIPVRTGVVIDQYKRKGWLNPVGGPSFSLFDGVLYPNNTKLTISYLSGQRVIYTTDGTDPRMEGGAVNPNAITASTPLVLRLTTTTTFWARIFANNGWSPLEKMTFRIDTGVCDACGKLVISELNYNPETKRTGFIEVKNVGTQKVNLNGMYLQGVRYTFPPAWLQPGQFWVIADSWEQFKLKYGRYPSDHYWLVFDGEGETIAIRDAAKNKVHSIDYGSRRPWSELPDGYGYTLVPRHKNYTAIIENPSSAKLWRPSANKGGSPFADDPEPTYLKDIPLIVNEVMNNPATGKPSWVEFYNPTGAPYDMSKFVIADSYNDKSDTNTHTIAPATSIPANGYKTFDSTVLKFNVDPKDYITGGKYALFQTACCDRKDASKNYVTGQFIEQDFDIAPQGFSQGFYKSSKSVPTWGLLGVSTPAGANSRPYRSPVVLAGIVPLVDKNTAPDYKGMEYVRVQSWSTSPINVNGWQVRIGYKDDRTVVNLTGTLQPRQNIYITKFKDLALFKKTFTLAQRDPTAILMYLDFPTLFTKITVAAPVPPSGKFVILDMIQFDQRFSLPKKRSTQAATPAELTRLPSDQYDGNDPASWQAAFIIPPPVDCQWLLWTQWSACSVTCGGSTQTRTRGTIPEQYGGADCIGVNSEVRSCNTNPCPIDCVWNQWSSWSTCVVSCGGSTIMRSRDYTVEKHGGHHCEGPEIETQDCNTQSCPLDCIWSEWGAWTSCTESCGGGFSFRSRDITSEALYGGLCLGSANDTITCNSQTCYPAFSIALLCVAGVIILTLLAVVLHSLFSGGEATSSATDAYTSL